MAAKGKPIGPRRGGMLPPSGAGPVEVTPEWVAQQQAAVGATAPSAAPSAGAPVTQAAPAAAPVPTQPAAPTHPVPTVQEPVTIPAELTGDLPSPDAPRSEIVARCEQLILAATIEFKEAERKAVNAWFGKVAPAVRLVHATKAYKELTDTKGRPYKSFERWAAERCGISRAHANRMVNEGPVAEALTPVYAGDLTTRQVDVLAPVLRQHGPDAVRRLWTTAAAAGGTGYAQLVTTRDALGLNTRPEDYEPTREVAAAPPTTALVQVRKAAHGIDREQLRQAALADPDGAREAVTVARRFADELQAVLAEMSGGSSSD